MTLVGLVPPLCDNGNMLVDGGYSELSSMITCASLINYSLVDNLPVCDFVLCLDNS